MTFHKNDRIVNISDDERQWLSKFYKRTVTIGKVYKIEIDGDDPVFRDDKGCLIVRPKEYYRKAEQ